MRSLLAGERAVFLISESLRAWVGGAAAEGG